MRSRFNFALRLAVGGLLVVVLVYFGLFLAATKDYSQYAWLAYAAAVIRALLIVYDVVRWRRLERELREAQEAERRSTLDEEVGGSGPAAPTGEEEPEPPQRPSGEGNGGPHHPPGNGV